MFIGLKFMVLFHSSQTQIMCLGLLKSQQWLSIQTKGGLNELSIFVWSQDSMNKVIEYERWSCCLYFMVVCLLNHIFNVYDRSISIYLLADIFIANAYDMQGMSSLSRGYLQIWFTAYSELSWWISTRSSWKSKLSAIDNDENWFFFSMMLGSSALSADYIFTAKYKLLKLFSVYRKLVELGWTTWNLLFWPVRIRGERRRKRGLFQRKNTVNMTKPKALLLYRC